jgi:hypothetical protein
MNEQIKKLWEQTEIDNSKNIYAMPDERAEQFAKLLIKDILNQMHTINLNMCASTTYDLGIIECARQKLIYNLEDNYGLLRAFREPNTPRDFPVKNSHNIWSDVGA